MSKPKGHALRVGGEIWVPPNATTADYDTAWAMMTPDEHKRYAKQFVRDLKWTVWRMKHPKWASFLDACCVMGLAVVRSPRY